MQQALTLLVRGVVGLLRLFALDKRSLALFRICMGILTVYDLQQRFPDIHNHYSDRGIISRSLALDKFHNYYWLSVHMLAGNDFYTQLVFLMHGAIAIGMIIGYHSRLMTFLNWIMVCSLQNRNYVVCHSGDTVQRVMLFWAIFLPLGEVFSLDSLLGKKKAKKERGNINYEVLGFGAMAFTIQIYIMYVTAHFHKSAPEWRELGTATWMALQLDFFRSWVGDIFSLSPWLCKQLTFAVLYWQVTGVVLYFLPVGKYNKYLKAFSVFGYFCMHLGFGMCLMLEQFTWVTEASLMGVVPGWVWEELIKYFEGKQKKALQIHYLKRCRFCSLTAEILGLFMLPKTKIIATDSLPGRKEYGFMGIVVVDSNRVEHNGPAVFEVITKESPILYPLHYVLRNKFVQNVISVMSHQLHYHKITHESDDTKYDPESGVSIDIGVDNYGAAQTQTHAGEEGTNGASQLDVYKTRTPKKNKTFKNESLNMYALRKTAPIVGKVIVEGWLAFLLFLVLTWNAGNIHYYQFATPNALRPIMWVTQLDQYWGMFAPRPPDVLWWYNIEGELDDGTTVELFNDGVLFNWKPNIPHTFDKPKSVHASMGNHRWFKLFENGLNSHEAREDLRLNFGRWICREYNGRYFDKERLYKFSIHWMNERVDTALQDGTRYPGPKQTIWNHVCYDK